MIVVRGKSNQSNRRIKSVLGVKMIYHHKLKPSMSSISLLIVIIQLATSLQTIQLANGAYTSDSAADESNYEPEKQTDGPPRVPGPSRNLLGPARSDEHHNDESHQAEPSRAVLRRADLDPEEEFDDDERDEDKSGSSQHGSFENPSFGESRRAAKDGEDIENFFDKHLGPPADAASGNSDDAETSAPVVSERIDPDDGYETAASTPLSDIFHTLIKAHRRPFVITTTSSGDDTSASTPDGQQRQPQSNVAPAAAAAATAVAPTTGSQSIMSPQASNTISSAPSQQMGPAPPLIRPATPFMDPTPYPIMAQAAMSPLAYFAPIAAPSTLSPYEPPPPPPPHGVMQPEASGHEHGMEYPGSQGREIYIVRRPSVLQHIRAVAPPLQRLVQQSSNAHWTRGLPYGGVHHHPHPYPRAYAAEESPQAASAADYHSYPIGAHSYAYQREQPHRGEPTEPDEPNTVSYGLSFGGAHASAADGGAAADEPENGAAEEQSSAVDEPPAPAPYHSGYGVSRNPVRFSSQSTRAYNNYNYPPSMGAQAHGGGSPYPAAYMRGQGGSPAPSQQYQHHYHGARYHKDPSESAAQPVNYNAQYSPMHSGSNRENYASWLTRQQLLADLDRQIKNNQYYRQNTASSPSAQYQQQSPAPITVRRRFKTRLSKDDNDVDTYSSFHSEVDPYKSFTASSKLVNEPQPDNTVQQGRHREPSSDMASRPGARRNQGDNNNPDNAYIEEHKGLDSDQMAENSSNTQPKPNINLVANPVSRKTNSKPQKHEHHTVDSADIVRNNKDDSSHHNHRVRREDADDRETDEVDDAGDDGVWVDDDDDDDNRQTASDLNETTQEPEEDENQQEVTRSAHVPGVIGNPHGYELS